MEEALRNILEDPPGGDKGGEGVSKSDKIQALNLLIKIVAKSVSSRHLLVSSSHSFLASRIRKDKTDVWPFLVYDASSPCAYI